jgi:ankyrin repeat protein
MKLINTNIDNYYLNPYKFIYKKDYNDVTLNNNIHNKNNLDDSKKIGKIDKNNKVNDFNPLLFKLVANNNLSQLDNILKINKNININEQDKDGDTPLHIAVFLCNIKIVNVFLNYNANILIKDKWGQIPIHRLCFSINDKDILELVNMFLNLNKNIFNEQDNYGNTPLHLILKHIIKNNIILKDNHNILINNIKKIMNTKLKNNDNHSISDLIKIINKITV